MCRKLKVKIQNIGKAFVLGSFCVIASTTQVQALDFSFSLNGDSDNPGTVTGIIKGVGEGGSLNEFSVVEVLSSSNPNHLGTYSYYDGSFSVVDNIITAANQVQFSQEVYLSAYDYVWINYIDFNNYYNVGNGVTSPDGVSVYNYSGFAGVEYTAATAVPWDFNPAEGAALGVPLFVGLRLFSKKKLARKSTAIKVTQAIS